MILIILAVLAVLDLIVGVSNDAINFLNSSLGSKVAPLKVILAVAACGILLGVATSSGMMEVARNGVFRPQMFSYSDVMFLFVGLMLSDVILLNTFNALGLPTSTTISLIFELLGSAVAVALFKIVTDDALSLSALDSFINTGKAFGMITGILCSVLLAFIAGSVLMFVSRVIFSFKYTKALRRFGPMWCGASLVGIAYFAVFKGLKSSGLITPAVSDFIGNHLGAVVLALWLLCTSAMVLLRRRGEWMLRVTILSGTFALALAFAGNDLVNFIGVPLAGFDAYNIALNNGDETMLMGGLAEPVAADVWLLLAAGVIMTLTLFFSHDAMRVSQTELKLSSGNNEDERFGSSMISRQIVRSALVLNRRLRACLPPSWIDAVNSRFVPNAQGNDGAMYDKIRAVVNLTAASILICIGTSLKLPLSTTYVVFMVAMGSSLADRAWGRDSAVYRISGVLIVISGWFMTAVVGFVVSLAIGLSLMWGGAFALAALVVLCGWLLCRRLIVADDKKEQEALPSVTEERSAEETLCVYTEAVCHAMEEVSGVYNRMLVALYTESLDDLKMELRRSEQMYRSASAAKNGIVPVLKQLESNRIETAHFYVQVVDYLCEVTKALLHCTKPAYDHINNNHRGFDGTQIRELKRVNDGVDAIFAKIATMLRERDFTALDELMSMRDNLFDVIADCVKSQIVRLGDAVASARAGALYLNILNETKTMVLQSRNLIKAQAHFVSERVPSDK